MIGKVYGKGGLSSPAVAEGWLRGRSSDTHLGPATGGGGECSERPWEEVTSPPKTRPDLDLDNRKLGG